MNADAHRLGGCESVAAGVAARVAAVLLDLDGTLVDTATDLALATNAVLARFRHGPLEIAQIRSFIGTGEYDLLRQALAAARGLPPSQALLAQAHIAFIEAYAVENGRSAQLYAGVQSGLLRLREAGVRMAVVTNKPQRFSRALLESLNVAQLFDAVVSGDTTPYRKPHPAPLWHACSDLGVAPSACVMVGDSAIDIASARAAGCAALCVTYGYHRGSDLRSYGVPLIESLDELPRRLLAQASRVA